MIRTIMLLLVIGSIIIVPIFPAVFAQEELTQHYDDGEWSFSYPRSWYTGYHFFDGLMISTKPDPDVETDLRSGDSLILLQSPLDNLFIMDYSGRDVLTVNNLLGAWIQIFEEDGSSVTIVGRNDTVLNHRPVTIVRLSTSIADVMVLVLEFSDSDFVTLLVVTASGSMPLFERTILAIASTIEYTPKWERFDANDVVYDIAISPDGSLLAGATPQGLLLWELSTGIQVSTFSPPVAGWMRGIEFSPDNSLLAVAVNHDETETVQTFFWDVGRKMWREDSLEQSVPPDDGVTDTSGFVKPIGYSSDGAFLVVSDILWDLTTKEQRAVLNLNEGDSCNYPVFSTTSELLACAMEGTSVAIWDVQSGDLLGHYESQLLIGPDPSGGILITNQSEIFTFDRQSRELQIATRWPSDLMWYEQSILEPDGDIISSSIGERAYVISRLAPDMAEAQTIFTDRVGYSTVEIGTLNAAGNVFGSVLSGEGDYIYDDTIYIWKIAES